MTGEDEGSGRLGENRSGSLDRALSVLQDGQRRAVIAALVEADERTMTTDELADWLVERGIGVPRTPTLTLRLHHHHLPKLAEEGLVEFDPRSDMLRYLGDDEVERWLERFDEWES